MPDPRLVDLLQGEHNPTYLVTGALVSRIGKITSKQRLRQTVGTIASIRKNLPNGRLIYVDGSHPVHQVDQGLETLSPHVDQVFRLGSDVAVHVWDFMAGLSESSLRYPSAVGVTKSILESISLSVCLEKIAEIETPVLVKMSARYEVMRPRSRQPLARSYGVESQPQIGIESGLTTLQRSQTYLEPKLPNFPTFVRTVAWATKGVGFAELSKIFLRISTELETLLASDLHVDIEHAMARFWPHRHNEVGKLGVRGIIASSKSVIKL